MSNCYWYKDAIVWLKWWIQETHPAAPSPTNWNVLNFMQLFRKSVQNPLVGLRERQISFIFIQFSGEIWVNNRLAPTPWGLVHPIWEILDPPLFNLMWTALRSRELISPSAENPGAVVGFFVNFAKLPHSKFGTGWTIFILTFQLFWSHGSLPGHRSWRYLHWNVRLFWEYLCLSLITHFPCRAAS